MFIFICAAVILVFLALVGAVYFDLDLPAPLVFLVLCALGFTVVVVLPVVNEGPRTFSALQWAGGIAVAVLTIYAWRRLVARRNRS